MLKLFWRLFILSYLLIFVYMTNIILKTVYFFKKPVYKNIYSTKNDLSMFLFEGEIFFHENRTHRHRAVDGGVEPAERDAVAAQRVQHAFDLIGPGRGAILFEFAEPEKFPLWKGGRNDLNLAIRAR